ncbi:MAG TPA: HAD-IIIA family hydrolase [Polyangia bacterium]|jgi:histidinol-phosphate phosphatase family protein|nr:HAD-IIIA family hydrolase [Polyangia bacterium]
MDRRPGLIILDRDGVLNQTVLDPAEPRPDSPLRIGEVAVFPWVPAALRRLTDAGFGLVVATNQPSAAKGKTTRAALDAVHRLIVDGAQRDGGVILSSHICFHRAEDGCACRKPKTGLLEEAFRAHRRFTVADSWMVGDRANDVLAGAALGLRTALLGPPDAGDAALLASQQVRPFYCGADLRDFVDYLLGSK